MTKPFCNKAGMLTKVYACYFNHDCILLLRSHRTLHDHFDAYKNYCTLINIIYVCMHTCTLAELLFYGDVYIGLNHWLKYLMKSTNTIKHHFR